MVDSTFCWQSFCIFSAFLFCSSIFTWCPCLRHCNGAVQNRKAHLQLHCLNNLIISQNLIYRKVIPFVISVASFRQHLIYQLLLSAPFLEGHKLWDDVYYIWGRAQVIMWWVLICCYHFIVLSQVVAWWYHISGDLLVGARITPDTIVSHSSSFFYSIFFLIICLWLFLRTACHPIWMLIKPSRLIFVPSFLFRWLLWLSWLCCYLLLHSTNFCPV